MGTLREKLTDAATRQQVVNDGIKMIDAEVSDKGGFSGIPIKAAYALVKGMAPGIMPRLLNGMLDEFVDALQPFYDEAKQSGVDLKALFAQKQAAIANALLAVPDARAAKTDMVALKKAYEKLRPTGQKHVEQALPRLADFVKSFGG